MDELSRVRASQRDMWDVGDLSGFALMIRGAGGRLVRRLAIGADDTVLDVACGTGNVAIQAAATGARVTGLDIAPTTLEAARRAASEEGVRVDWIEGDAESLPFPTHSFDVAASSFGCMFAPRHEVAAAEMVRVLRPGGRLGILAWSVDGPISEFLALVAPHLPSPPPLAAPPPLWGDEGHVRGVFAGTGIDLTIEHDHLDLRFASADAATREYTERFGPLVAARALLEPEGRWDEVVMDVAAFFARHARPGGGVVVEGDHLVIVGHVPG